MVQVNTFWSGILLPGTFSYLAWISVTPQPPNSSSAPTYTISNLMLPCPIGLVLMPCVWTNSILPYHVTRYFFKVLEINFLTQKCVWLHVGAGSEESFTFSCMWVWGHASRAASYGISLSPIRIHYLVLSLSFKVMK